MVKQTITDKGSGDCLRACVASLLELKIEQVPHFILYGTPEWHYVMLGFLEILGWQCEGVMNYSEMEGNVVDEKFTIGGNTIASVPSKNYKNTTHAVVIDTTGAVVNDPSTGESYFGENIIESGAVNYWWLFESNGIEEQQ